MLLLIGFVDNIRVPCSDPAAHRYQESIYSIRSGLVMVLVRHIFEKVSGLVHPGSSVKCVTSFSRRTLIGRQDAGTLLYSISPGLVMVRHIISRRYRGKATQRANNFELNSQHSSQHGMNHYSLTTGELSARAPGRRMLTLMLMSHLVVVRLRRHASVVQFLSSTIDRLPPS